MGLQTDSSGTYDFVVGSQADSCRFYSEATPPENRAAQIFNGHFGPIVKEGCDLTFAWGECSGFYSLSSKGNPLIELTILLILWSSSSAEKQVCTVLAIESRLGPCTQVKAQHLTAATGHPSRS